MLIVANLASTSERLIATRESGSQASFPKNLNNSEFKRESTWAPSSAYSFKSKSSSLYNLLLILFLNISQVLDSVLFIIHVRSSTILFRSSSVGHNFLKCGFSRWVGRDIVPGKKSFKVWFWNKSTIFGLLCLRTFNYMRL